MSELVINWYLRLFDLLSAKHKVELLSRLKERVKTSFANEENHEEATKEEALLAMMEDWEDIVIDGDSIVNNRTSSSRVYDL